LKRNTQALTAAEFDVLVVGGGIHGACVARDAALRGLTVALIEQGDFSSATSHNSLKTIHGGIRYLQHLNFKRAIESVREQQILLRTAPHLVKPLQFLMPNYGWGMRGPLVMGIGIAMFEALSFLVSLYDRRRPQKIQGRLFGRKHCLRLAPGIEESDLTGGSIWGDAQVALADKAVLSILQHAEDNGAVVSNYIRAQSLVKSENKSGVTGVQAVDQVSGEALSIKATLVVNAAGPWVAEWLSAGTCESDSVKIRLVKSMNLVTGKPAPDVSIGIKSRRQSDSKVDSAKRLFFIVPWQGRAIIGTSHFTHRTGTPEIDINDAEIQAFIDEFAAAYPAYNLSLADVLYCYQGLTPGDDSTDEDGAKLHHSKVVDHAQTDNVDGMVSIIGIKWTTARLVAERTVDLVISKLGRKEPCSTRHVAIPDYPDMDHDIEDLPQNEIRQFVLQHVQTTQARYLSDIVLRRTNDLVLGKMTIDTVEEIHRILTQHFSWTEQEQRDAWADLYGSGLSLPLRQTLEKYISGAVA